MTLDFLSQSRASGWPSPAPGDAVALARKTPPARPRLPYAVKYPAEQFNHGRTHREMIRRIYVLAEF